MYVLGQRGGVCTCWGRGEEYVRVGAEGRSTYLVQQEDVRVDEECTGDGHTLLLSPGESDPPLPHQRVVALLEAQDEVVRIRLLRRRHDLCTTGIEISSNPGVTKSSLG
jgi:hypothetical protein